MTAKVRRGFTRRFCGGFSLMEMLVVISTVSVMMAVLMPALVVARSHARAVVCRSNLRQLVLANMEYTNDNDGFCVPAASDMYPGGKNLRRWHGVRDNKNEPFDPRRGLFVDYLGDGQVKECPTRVEFTKDQPGHINFELGCGGYGYNMQYIGSRLSFAGMERSRRYEETARLAEVKRPRETLMFADCAMARSEGQYIEYSFAEPVHPIINGEVKEHIFLSPSIHFRHRDLANVGWADGHIEPRKMAGMDENNVWNVNSARMSIGWFEPVDNAPFDLQ